jgi:hypothetical protein
MENKFADGGGVLSMLSFLFLSAVGLARTSARSDDTLACPANDQVLAILPVRLHTEGR